MDKVTSLKELAEAVENAAKAFNIEPPKDLLERINKEVEKAEEKSESDVKEAKEELIEAVKNLEKPDTTAAFAVVARETKESVEVAASIAGREGDILFLVCNAIQNIAKRTSIPIGKFKKGLEFFEKKDN